MTTEEKPEDEQKAEKSSSAKAGGAKRSTTRGRTQATAKSAAGGKGTKTTGSRASAKGGGKAQAKARGQQAAAKAPPAAKEEAPAAKPGPAPLPRMLARFRQEVSQELIKEFGYPTPMQVPRLRKIVLNIGVGGEAVQNPKAIEGAARDVSLISGQRPITTRARKSIAGFKLREGMAIGVAVTLRGRRMYEFLDRLTSSSLPRIRDFRGLSREAFDGRGNYTLGISEQVIFPEIDYNTIDRIRGLQVIIVTSARTDREGLRLLELLGMPFVRTETGARAA